MSIELGELSNGVALTQVTTDTRDKSNIYCELPYCSSLSMSRKIQIPRPIPPNISPANLAHGKPRSSVAVWADLA